MHVSIRQIGNSLGVLIPKALLAEASLSLESGAEMTLEGAAIVLRKPAAPQRHGWGEAAMAIAGAGDDRLVLADTTVQADDEVAW
jgi:antitoxin MazE